VPQTVLEGCEVKVVEQQSPTGETVRCIVATNPRSGDSWALPLTGAAALQVGRALLGQALLAPESGVIRVNGG
jgi:hypothetical protein